MSAKKRAPFTKDEKEDIVSRFQRGQTKDFIAYALGCDKRPIIAVLVGAGLGQEIAGRTRHRAARWAWGKGVGA